MKTLYDIGDEIEINLRGVVKEYSISEHGDSYKIGLKGTNLNIYLSTDEIKYTSRKINPSNRFCSKTADCQLIQAQHKLL